MGIMKRYLKINREENDLIRRYFRECLETINDSNLYMLRKACMYISMVYIIMLIIASFILQNFKYSFIYFSVVPLMCAYFFVNLYTIKNRGNISTGQTAFICCSYYFLLGVILGLIDVFEAPAGQAIWLPIAVLALPMIFIDRIYKYGFEELVVLTIMLVMSFFHKPHDYFIRDLYIAISSYVISILSARIILEMRAREALAMEEITRLSSMDKLTHVLNKGALLQRIESYYLQKPADEFCAMCIIDLDDFKLVNDNLGHNVGDVLLERVGHLLTENFRAYDIVGRYGGDEFVVVMPKMADITILQMRCKALQMYISEVMLGNSQPFTASIGSILSSGVNDTKVLFTMADDALYKSKIQGKNSCTTWIYEPTVIEKKILLLIANRQKDYINKVKQIASDKYELLTVFNEDEGLRHISQYHNQIEAILLEFDGEAHDDAIVLKYVKHRESFANIPVLAICTTPQSEHEAFRLKADRCIEMNAPTAEYKKIVEDVLLTKQ